MNKQSDTFLLAEKMDWKSVCPGLKRKIMGYNDDIMMVQIQFDTGGVGEKHNHIHSQTSFVMSGKFEAHIADEERILETGDGFYIPPNVIHGIKCLEEGILIDVFSPVREDFLAVQNGYSQ